MGTRKESPPQGRGTAAVVPNCVGSCGGELSDLEYPKTLSVAGKKLAALPADLVQ
jgi:hypothetical protein